MYTVDFEKPIHVYFIGIGGISMSGLAEILAKRNFTVSGSDARRSALTDSLSERGIHVVYGQRSENITDDINLVVYTAAIKEDNPELVAAKALHIPTMTRAELLGQIMKNYGMPVAVAGTHGKTTTTSMISEILMHAQLDPTVSVGGMLKTIGGNIRIGGSQYFVTEACEYTNSFLSFFPKIGIILNVEEDHMDFFKDIEDILHSFHEFAALLPEDGTLIINGDIPQIDKITEGLKCRVVTFGARDTYDYYPSGITYDELARPTYTLHSKGSSETITLGVTGEHNVYNSLAAVALSDLLGAERSVVREALSDFRGTDRRFEYKGSIGGVTILDDYAHHPTEISATLKAAANYPHERLICVFQPHTYTRTKTFLDEFATALSLADIVVLAEIYPARETDTLGISSRNLQEKITALGKPCYYFPSFDEIENFLLEKCEKKDLLITMGAGDVVKIGEKLLGQ
ncbi:MAG: UDP-N-acetylmuramate--L-alanine ligase [Lachnospiraceae bacterium]|nr:UDP-N-acetylmuramate--L-alanine ligase [Lachnospiraceae bacterium]